MLSIKVSDVTQEMLSYAPYWMFLFKERGRLCADIRPSQELELMTVGDEYFIWDGVRLDLYDAETICRPLKFGNDGEQSYYFGNLNDFKLAIAKRAGL